MVRYALAGDLLGDLSRNWWLLVVRGVAAVIFGALALFWPGITMVALAIVFGVFALVDGISLGIAAFRATSGTRTPMVIQSVLSVLLGLGALIWPIVAVFALVMIIAVWAIVTGVAEIVTAVRMRSQISSEWLLIFVGALSVIFGLLLLLWPGLGALAIITVIGVYAIIFGVALAIAGFRLKGTTASATSTVTESDASAEDQDVEGVDLLDGPTGEKDSQEASAFDGGYVEGYRAGYEGGQRFAGATEASVFKERATSERGGKHRAPKDPPEGTDMP